MRLSPSAAEIAITAIDIPNGIEFEIAEIGSALSKRPDRTRSERCLRSIQYHPPQGDRRRVLEDDFRETSLFARFRPVAISRMATI